MKNCLFYYYYTYTHKYAIPDNYIVQSGLWQRRKWDITMSYACTIVAWRLINSNAHQKYSLKDAQFSWSSPTGSKWGCNNESCVLFIQKAVQVCEFCRVWSFYHALLWCHFCFEFDSLFTRWTKPWSLILISCHTLACCRCKCSRIAIGGWS